MQASDESEPVVHDPGAATEDETAEEQLEAPWAMQLAARAEKLTPPTVADTCVAAVLAVIGLLEDEQAGADGRWAAPIESWQGGGRIRKIVRRARASAWERAQVPAGNTATFGTGEVRAYVPSRTDQTPEQVRKLQIQSTPLDEPEPVGAVPEGIAPGMVVVITPEVTMSWGKQAAQAAHAGQILWRESTADELAGWTEGGRFVTVLHATSEWWPEAVRDSRIQIRDGGFTEIPAGTMSAVAWWHSLAPSDSPAA